MSEDATSPSLPAIESPTLVPDPQRTAALDRLLDPNPPYVTGLSDNFLIGNYGNRPWHLGVL